MREQQRPPGRDSGFRRDIQALRALAVMLVVLNHLWPNRLPGGYVGVDVFFVISGFLISKHLVKELRRDGRIGLAEFYARRVRRLLPAALLVAAVSLAGVAVIMREAMWPRNATEVVASALYVENWYLAAKAVDYSALTDTASVAQHYWSLSVEEQFYLLWPVLLLACVWVARKRRLRYDMAILVGVLLVFVVSLVFGVAFTVTSKEAAYFVTPARAWEFALGALTGLLAGRLRLAPAFRGLLTWVGLALILLASLAFDHATFFPGIAALLPTLGTAAVIAAGERPARYSPALFMNLRPVQFLGGISYSVYLWHWPLVVLAPHLLDSTLTARHKLVLLAATIVLAHASKTYVEDPGIRMRWPAAAPRRTFSLMAAAMAVLVVAAAAQIHAYGVAADREVAALAEQADDPCYGASALTAQGCGDAFGPAETSPGDPAETPWFAPDGCVSEAGVRDCDFTGTNAGPTVWLVGDSHAEHWQAALVEVARAQGWHLKMSLRGGCPLVDAETEEYAGRTLPPDERNACREWGRQTADRVVAKQPAMVFTSMFSQHEILDDGTGRSQQDQYRDAAGTYLRRWADAGAQVYVIRDTPLTAGPTTVQCAAVNEEDPVDCAIPRAAAIQEDYVALAAEAVGHDSVRVLDLTDQFCDNTRCYTAVGGLSVFYDENHIARSYARSVAPAFLLAYRGRE